MINNDNITINLSIFEKLARMGFSATHSVNQLSGILKVKTSYENGNAEIEFDHSKTTIVEIEKTINSKGYSVIITKQK